MRLAPRLILSMIAAGFGWLFVTRYWLYRDCIEAAASSCVTPFGDNLIAGGALWIVPAVVFALLALLTLRRRR